jgi:hypothetical protein
MIGTEILTATRTPLVAIVGIMRCTARLTSSGLGQILFEAGYLLRALPAMGSNSS